MTRSSSMGRTALTGRCFAGRFKSVLIPEESKAVEMAGYIHLNPVRIGGLGLSKEDQRRARVLRRNDVCGHQARRAAFGGGGARDGDTISDGRTGGEAIWAGAG